MFDIIDLKPVPARLMKLDGSVIDADIKVHPARELGNGFTLVTARDINHEGLLAHKAFESEVHFQQLVDHSMQLICRCKGRRIVYINRSGCHMLGAQDPDQIINLPVENLFAGHYRQVFEENLSYLMEAQDVLPVRLARLDGTELDAQIQVTPFSVDHCELEYMIEARDISAHIRAVATLRRMNDTLEQQIEERTVELRRLASSDPLTGIANRRHFLAKATIELDRSNRTGSPLSVMMLDIDHFKQINDTWGHGVGDRAIKAVANVCTNAIRSIDMVGRLGGEEFGLILPETTLDAAQVVAERIRQGISAIQLDVGNGTYQFFATIGVAELHHSDMSFDDILQRADRALYEGKAAGRNCVVASVLSD